MLKYLLLRIGSDHISELKEDTFNSFPQILGHI